MFAAAKRRRGRYACWVSQGMDRMTTLRRMLDLAVADGAPKRAFWVAVIVGTVLNLINQGDAIFGDPTLNWLKLGLTYVVPFLVSTHGAVSARLSQEKRPK